ncbi:MAG: nitrite reductase large subunit [Streptosporangiales bacterium]|nr:nitrite reductase large subunit [Streptosporangiales bacterium]
MAAHRLLTALGDRGDTRPVVVFGEEPHPAYDRVHLSGYLEEGDPEQGARRLRLPEIDAPNVTLRLGERVTAVDRTARTVTTSTGDTLGYETLVLATGSAPFVPPLPGHDLPGCFVYRTLDDLDAIRAHAQANPGTGVVIGGGLLGLEAAGALRGLGLDTHVVELAPWLMPRQLDAGGGEALRQHVENLGVTVHAGTATGEIRPGPDGAAAALALADGTTVDTRTVVFSAGIRPRDELARQAGLPVAERGGVLVDTHCRTEDPYVYAIGECAAVEGTVYGLVAPGNAMADVVAARLTGDGTRGPFGGADADTSTRLKLLDVEVAGFGDPQPDGDVLDVTYADPVTGVYKRLILSDDARTLLGGVLVGDGEAYPALRACLGGPLPDAPDKLLFPGGADPGAGLPDEARVCSCNNVTKAGIVAAIDAGTTAMPELKACTRAGATCGSCVPLMKKILDERLTATGRTVSHALCEHFPHSRRELYDIVAVRGITTFSQVIAEHGSGRGCDICKPAVASILAGLRGGHVLDGEAATLQDTNDHFLANLQKNGTYSVVPRVPGGEITPERLIVIGEVARDFGLYTKITGGQRIDMFGARVDQLPAIWRRLVDAGFESGHAYGKALRTVKSCVGSTWCRYGVQDSAGLAVALELRYRGLRSPHKIKAAVSGCARECAEANSKDFGVIATENGWNLLVGGNGGFRPRHAATLAADLTTEELIRYVDRFLMYYIRTADRLQRTATWIEDLDGGLDHLRDVIIGDSLGICADLDAAMERHIGDYTDEWAATLADPDKLRRFVSFVNAPGTPDPSIAFEVEREQIKPVLIGPDLEVVRK